MFNDEQAAHMKYLSTLRLDQLCHCGWYAIGDCFTCNREHPGKTRLDHPDNRNLKAKESPMSTQPPQQPARRVTPPVAQGLGQEKGEEAMKEYELYLQGQEGRFVCKYTTKAESVEAAKRVFIAKTDACIKCGQTVTPANTGTQYVRGVLSWFGWFRESQLVELLHRTCGCCGYTWCEPTQSEEKR